MVAFLAAAGFTGDAAARIDPFEDELPRRQTLLIGDSHMVGHFGKQLHKLLEEEGSTPLTVAVGATRPVHYVRGSRAKFFARRGGVGVVRWHEGKKMRLSRVPKLASLVSGDNPPKKVVIGFGTNMAGHMHNSKGRRKEYSAVTKLLSQLPEDAACIWVGPPVSRRKKVTRYLQRTVDVISAGIEDRCQFIDSRDITTLAMLSRDGVHLSKRGGKLWADRVISRMAVN